MPPSPAHDEPPRPARAGLLAREALGFWLLGLGVLGLVRGWMRATRHGGFELETIAALWLGGSAVVAVLGALRIWRAARAGRG